MVPHGLPSNHPDNSPNLPVPANQEQEKSDAGKDEGLGGEGYAVTYDAAPARKEGHKETVQQKHRNRSNCRKEYHFEHVDKGGADRFSQRNVSVFLQE